MLQPDVTRLTFKTALEALGLGFFSIGVGFAVLITYAAYTDARINLVGAAIVTLIADTAISLLSGFTVFPIVFASGLDPAAGPGLVFVTLPVAFAQMRFGTLAASAFFALLFIAALASAISLLEIGVRLVMRRLAWSRLKASIVLTAGCFLLGLASVLSFNRWSRWYPLDTVAPFAESTFFDLIDYGTSNVLLPIAGFALAVFAGWVIPASHLSQELGLSPRAACLLRWLLRYLVPAAILGASLAPLLA